MENTERNRRFWVGVASREHVQLGLSGGFAQFSHGKPGPAKRPRRGDGILYYQHKARWAAPFRFGFFEIPEADFQLIADAMEAHA